MTTRRDPPAGVKIGNVTGGITHSVIAGRDVKGATITVGGQPVPADKTPSVEELRTLLAEIQSALASLAAQKAVLEKVSPDAPFVAQGAEATVRAAAEKVPAAGDPGSEDAGSVQKGLKDATGFLGGILDGVRKVAEKAGAAAEAVKPLGETLMPLLDKLAVAALWAAKLWG